MSSTVGARLGPAALVLAAPAVAALAALDARLAALPAAILTAALLTVAPWARAVVLVVGGMLILQSTPGLDERKLLYLGASAYALLFTLLAVARALPRLPRRWQGLLGVSAAWLVVVAASYWSAASSGVPLQSWVRDIIPYVLIGLAPFFAVDLGLLAASRRVAFVIVVLGSFAAVGTAVSWLTRRGVSTLGVEHLLLPTSSLPALALGIALILAVRRDRRAFCAAAALLIVAAMLLPGTRTNLVLILGLAALAGPVSRGLLGTSKLITVGLAGLLSLAVVLPLLAGVLISRQDFFARRLADFNRVVESGVSADASGRERIYAYRLLGAHVAEHPWFGVGPGYTFPRLKGGGASSLDTPLVVAAKFGLLGATMLLILLIALVVVMRSTAPKTGPVSPLYAGARSYLLTLLLLSPFGAVWEDKGFGFSLVLLLAGLLATERERSGDPPPVRSGPADQPRARGPLPAVGPEVPPPRAHLPARASSTTAASRSSAGPGPSFSAL